MLFPLLLATLFKIMINTNPTGRDTTEVAVQRLSQKLITKLNLQGSSRVFEDDSNNISAHDSVPRALSKLNAALTAFDLSDRQDAEPIDSSKSYSEGEIVYAEGASWRVAAGGADAGDLPSTHPDKFVSFQEGVTSIANKEAAYALTGVAAGTVYKTDDTGQVLEKVDHVPAIQQSFIIGTDGDPKDGGGTSVSGLWTWDAANDYFDHATNENVSMTHTGSFWRIHYTAFGQFDSAPCAASVHPADATPWVTSADPTFPGTGSINEIDVNEPRNWKHDGVLLVNDNDEKQLLTNLPDGQRVEVVGEGGRLERFNGDGDGLNQGDFKILVNHPDNPVIDNMEINGIYTYYPNSYYYQNDDGVVIGDFGDGTYVIFTGSVQWSAPVNSLATPDLMSPWTALTAAAQGYAAMTSDMITRQPAATESNWRTIKNTVYLTVADNIFGASFVFNGVSVSSGSTQGIGWVAVTEPLEQNSAWQFKVAGVNGDTSLTVAGDIQCITSGTQTILPDVFPSGALVTIDNA